MPTARPAEVQFGCVQLLIEPFRAVHFSADWQDLQLVLSDLHPKDAEEQKLLDALAWLLDDAVLQFRGSVKVEGPLATIRVQIGRSDHSSSQWPQARFDKNRTKHLRTLFASLREGWDTDSIGKRLLETDSRAPIFLLTTQGEDDVDVQDLYSSVPSPDDPDFASSPSEDDNEVFALLMEQKDLGEIGVQSQLHPWQFRSVGKMLQMEIDPEEVDHPTLTRFPESGRAGEFYVRLQDDMDVQGEGSKVKLPRGGILCEQMGVGKTLMCLTLVCATLHQAVRPPMDDTGAPKDVTNVALRNNSYAHERELRRQLEVPEPHEYARLSLRETCADILAKHHGSMRVLRERVDDRRFIPPGMDDFFDERHAIYVATTIPAAVRSMRYLGQELHHVVPTHKKMILANSTLIIVPKMLLEQWVGEIAKHTAPQALRVLVIRNQVPNVEEMIQYDIILMDYEGFSREAGKASRTSQFLELAGSGLYLANVAGVKINNAMAFAETMSIERRWAVTGTPTKHLQQGGEAEITLHPDDGSIPGPETGERKSWTKYGIDDVRRFGYIVSGFLAAPAFNSGAGFQDTVTAGIRKKDGPSFGSVRRLKELMNTLMVKHQPQDINAESRLPPCSTTVTFLRSHPMQRLTYNVLAAHVATNVYQYPAKSARHLLNKKKKKSFNEVINDLRLACIWNSRPKVDAMSSLRGAVALLDPLELSERLQLYEAGCLDQGFSAGESAGDSPAELINLLCEDLEDVKPDFSRLPGAADDQSKEETHQRARKGKSDRTIDTRPDAYFLDNDFEQYYENPSLSTEASLKLKEACRHFRAALNTSGWSEWQEHANCLPFDVSADQISPNLQDVWSDSMLGDPSAIDAESLQIMRTYNARGATEQSLRMTGWEARAAKCTWFKDEIDRNIARDRRVEKKRERDALKEAQLRGRHLPWTPLGFVAAMNAIFRPEPDEQKKSQRDRNAKKKQQAKQGKKEDTKPRKAKKKADTMIIDESVARVMPATIFTSSRSAKVNHIIKRLMEADKDDRFIVFGEPEQLGHLAVVLRLIECSFTSVVAVDKANERVKGVKEYSEDPEMRVLLLETKLAARGLNLTKANRMIFLAPIWSLDIQAQAIKRVHRIGQTRPTHIEILALEGTFEEDIVNRAANLRAEGEEQQYTRDMIERPRFIDVEEAPTERYPVPFIPQAERALLASLGLPIPTFDRSPVRIGNDTTSPASDLIITPDLDAGDNCSFLGLPTTAMNEAGPGPSTTLKRKARSINLGENEIEDVKPTLTTTSTLPQHLEGSSSRRSGRVAGRNTLIEEERGGSGAGSAYHDQRKGKGTAGVKRKGPVRDYGDDIDMELDNVLRGIKVEASDDDDAPGPSTWRAIAKEKKKARLA